jgi:hypothetical protein
MLVDPGSSALAAVKRKKCVQKPLIGRVTDLQVRIAALFEVVDIIL